MGFLCMNFQIDVICYRSDNDKTILKILFDKIKGNDGKYLSTSIPYQKNNNAHVEQKGGDKVRKLVEYFRYDSEEEVSLLKEIYERADLLDNFFIANFKLSDILYNINLNLIQGFYNTLPIVEEFSPKTIEE